MKKLFLLLLALMSLFSLSSCSDDRYKDDFKIIETDGDSVFLAGNEVGSLYRNSLKDVKIFKGKEKVSSDFLKEGMSVTVVHEGYILETFPASFGKIDEIRINEAPNEEYFDLPNLYLKALSDIFNEDSALNGNYIVLNLDNAPGNLSEGQKSAIAWRLYEITGNEVYILSDEEAKEEGLLVPVDENPEGIYIFKDGCKISIDGKEKYKDFNVTGEKIKFDLIKYKGPLGAYFLEGCQTVWNENSWEDYIKENEAAA